MLLNGISPWNRIPAVYALTSQKRNPRQLPQVTIAKRTVEATKSYSLTNHSIRLSFVMQYWSTLRIPRHYRIAYGIVTPINGCNIGEAALLPIIQAVFPEQYECQYYIRANRHDYYADFAIPNIKLLIEFDGANKMGSNREEFYKQRRQQLERQHFLENAEYSFMRVAWEDLQKPRDLYLLMIHHALKLNPQFDFLTSPMRTLLESEGILY